MKTQAPTPDTDRTARERFFRLGQKVMGVSKAEIEARDKQWQAGRPRRPKVKPTR